MTFYNALNVVSAICHWRAAQAIGFSSEADDPKVGELKVKKHLDDLSKSVT